MYISVILVGTALVCAWVWQWWSFRQARRCFKHLPTFPTLPILGHSYKFFGSSEGWYKYFVEASEKAEETDLPFVFWLGPYPVLLCSNPDDIRIMGNACIDKPYFFDFGRMVFGNGILTAPGDIWKRTIKKLGGTFTTSVVNSYQNIFSTQARLLANKLRSKVDDPPFDMLPELSRATFEAICSTALGTPDDEKNNINIKEYLKAFHEALEEVERRALNPFCHLEQIYRLTPGYRRLVASMNYINECFKSVVKKKMQQTPQEALESSKKYKTYLDILLSLKDSDPFFTPEQIQHEVNTIIIGGQETSATSLFFLFLAIGTRPDIQEKMYEELYEIFGDSDRLVETEDLERMKYCEAVVMETLRVYPPFALALRRTREDVQIKSCLIPKGIGCAINIFGASRSRRIFGPDAMEFRPERWLYPDFDMTSFYAFSYGRRVCIGKKYALALEKTILATLVREFRFTSFTENLRLKYDIPLRAITGNLIQVHARRPRPVQTTT